MTILLTLGKFPQEHFQITKIQVKIIKDDYREKLKTSTHKNKTKHELPKYGHSTVEIMLIVILNKIMNN